MWDRMSPGRDLARAFEIALVFARHGCGDLIRRIGLAEMLHRTGHVLPAAEALGEFAALPPPVRVRKAFEVLGPTFVKLGQILATRVDLFSQEWIEQFGALRRPLDICTQSASSISSGIWASGHARSLPSAPSYLR